MSNPKSRTKLATMNASVRYSSNSNLNKQVKKLPSESEDLSTYNIFKIIASICNACISKICEYILPKSAPTLAKVCKHKPCNCKECIAYLNHIENDRIELRLLYENKCRNEFDHVKYKNNNCKSCPARNCSNQAKCITYEQWQIPEDNPATVGDGAQINRKQFSQLGMFGKPIKKYIHGLSGTTVENYPVVVQGKQINVYDPICDRVLYICGRCECKEHYLGEHMEPQKRRCTGSSVCKCSLCECLSCPLHKEATFAESMESFKTSVMRNFVENEWKERSRDYEYEVQSSRTAKDCRHFRDCSRIIVSDENNSLNSNKHNYGKKPRHSLHQSETFNKPVKEILDNVYACNPDFETEENDKGVSTVNPNKILTDQLLKNKYGVYTLVNHETNTENITADKCIETDNLSTNKKNHESKVKNYEYTLKIEIITPNFDDNTKQAVKERIKRSSKNKIKEQTQKVMKDVIKDISKNSLLHNMFGLDNANLLQQSDHNHVGDTESQELNKIRSILKKNSPLSFKSTTPEKQTSSDIVTVMPKSEASKVEDVIVGCVAPLKNTKHNTGKGIDVTKSEVPSKDESLLSQNCWSPVPPTLPSLMTPVDDVKKLVKCVDAPSSDMKKPTKCLDDLRVQDPCVRRVSHHTVSLKWKLPKLIEEIMGYEILVDGKTIEKILNPKRCLAVVSCLPPVQRLMITIRSLPKDPRLRGLYPCTTIGYQPRANRFIRV